MTAASMSGCIGEPISWLALERFALAGDDLRVTEHVAACTACRACLDEIRADVVALPALVVPPPRRRWWLWAMPAFAAAAAAAALVLLIVRPRGDADNQLARATGVTGVKGVGDVVLGVVRERAGVIREDLHVFAPGDRWKVVVTCPPDRGAWFDVAVVEAGAATADYPIAPARIACGNRVVVPGAFELTGIHPNLVCVRVAAEAAPARAVPRPGDAGVACVTIRPE